MQQPEIGKKITDLRKAKGLTQEELVEKCNINVRTLQRIEAGEVIPRSYTLKVIFKALDYNFFEEQNKSGLVLFIKNVSEIVNLKKDTMKKVSILSSTILIILLGVLMINFIDSNKNQETLKKYVDAQNQNSIKWFNSGEIEKLLEDYADDACFYRNGHPSYCGKEEIARVLKSASNTSAFKLKAIELIDLEINGDLAIEKSVTTSILQSGEIMKTINIQHWKNIDGEWLIMNDIDVAVLE